MWEIYDDLIAAVPSDLQVSDCILGLHQNPEEAALRQRYIRQMETQENRLSELRTDRDKLESARSAAPAVEASEQATLQNLRGF